MSAPETGGPAFPGHPNDVAGMSLRDYFAAKAMVRLTGADPDGVMSADTLSMCAYKLADAMLEAREA